MGEQTENGELYMIPESGGKPIKINGIASLSEIQCVDNLAEESSYAWRSLMSEASFCFSIEVKGKTAKMLKRFARRTRRYFRRHEQQKKRKSTRMER